MPEHLSPAFLTLLSAWLAGPCVGLAREEGLRLLASGDVRVGSHTSRGRFNGDRTPRGTRGGTSPDGNGSSRAERGDAAGAAFTKKRRARSGQTLRLFRK